MPNRINKLFLSLLGTTIKHPTATHKHTCSNHLWGTQLLCQAGVTHRPSLLEDVVIMSKQVLRWHEGVHLATAFLVFPYKPGYVVMVSASGLGLPCLPSGSQCTKTPDNMMAWCLSCV